MRLFRLLLVLTALASPVVVRAQSPSIEYDVKAAFVLNFVRYVNWPAADRRAPFTLCVLGANPFGARLDDMLAGELWEGGPMKTRRIDQARDAHDCHLLYVPAAATTRFTGLRAALTARPVLTVGETRAFLTGGGMIHLFVEGNRVRFSVNQVAAEGVGLQVSSRLLRLARDVITPPQVP